MPDEKPARPLREIKIGIGAALPRRDVERLHALAAERNTSLSTLVRTALEKLYGTAKQPRD